MTFLELMKIVATVYPGDGIMPLITGEAPSGGDDLARFIVADLKDTFDRKKSNVEQLRGAVTDLQLARHDLDIVIKGLLAVLAQQLHKGETQ